MRVVTNDVLRLTSHSLLELQYLLCHYYWYHWYLIQFELAQARSRLILS